MDELLEAAAPDVDEVDLTPKYIAYDLEERMRSWREAHEPAHATIAPRTVSHLRLNDRLYFVVTNGGSAVAIETPSALLTPEAPSEVADALTREVGEATWFDWLRFNAWVGRGSLRGGCEKCARRPATIYGDVFNLGVVSSALSCVEDASDGDGEVAWLPLAWHHRLPGIVRIEPEHRGWIIVLLPMRREVVDLPWFAPEWPRDLRLLEPETPPEPSGA